MDNQMAPGRNGPFPDDVEIPLKADNWGAQIVLEQGGKYMEWVRRGLAFAARSGAAAAIPINTTLTNSPTLWNPANSGKILVPMKLLLSAATLGTQVIDGLTVSGMGNCGDGVATGGLITAFTNIAPVNLQVGSGKSAKARFANAAVTFGTNPSVIMDLGMGQWLNGTAAVGQPYTLAFDFEGCIIVPPGAVISIGAATAATSGTYWTTILYAELPLVAGGLD